MPEIGKSETYYAKLVHQADQQNNPYLRTVGKVGQYITLALNPHLKWEDKLKYFRHALKRHCQPPPYPDDDVWMFYQQLADLVRQYCGQEALRLASAEDDLYAARVSMGQHRDKIEDEAEIFFGKLMGSFDLNPAGGGDMTGSSLIGNVVLDLSSSDPGGDRCPDWFNEADWSQLKMIRDQWI
jgi:hypothetical protein